MRRSTWFAILLAMVLPTPMHADPGRGQNYLGINIGSVLDWEGNIVFADAMKSARDWCTPDGSWTALPPGSLDAEGWPTVDAELIVWAGLMRDNSGTYALS